MEKSQLTQLIFSFSPTEIREIRKFLESPFFNQRSDVVQLFDYLAQKQPAEKESAKRHLFGPATAVADQELRLRMTYLYRLLEQYLGVKECLADEHSMRIKAAANYRKRGLSTHFDRAKSQIEKKLAARPVRDAEYFTHRQHLEWESYQHNYALKPTETGQLLASDAAADLAYFSQKMRHICLLAAHRAIYEGKSAQFWAEDVLRMAAESPALRDEPCVAVYLHGYRMLTDAAEGHFQDFKKILLEKNGQFSGDETHALYLLAVNYCIKKINAGRADFNREALDLYKKGLETGFLFENGLLSRFAFSNIVAAGLHAGELDWVRFFINEHKNRLEKSHRDSSFSFNLARLEYASRNYSEVMSLLQKSNYRDPLHNLAAKTLLLKTFFELGELDSLASHLDAMRNYIHRKRALGYHRNNYLNLIKWVDKLLKINKLDKMELKKLRDGIEAEEVLVEKKWLLEMVELGRW